MFFCLVFRRTGVGFVFMCSFVEGGFSLFFSFRLIRRFSFGFVFRGGRGCRFRVEGFRRREGFWKVGFSLFVGVVFFLVMWFGGW